MCPPGRNCIVLWSVSFRLFRQETPSARESRRAIGKTMKRCSRMARRQREQQREAARRSAVRANSALCARKIATRVEAVTADREQRGWCRICGNRISDSRAAAGRNSSVRFGTPRKMLSLALIRIAIRIRKAKRAGLVGGAPGQHHDQRRRRSQDRQFVIKQRLYGQPEAAPALCVFRAWRWCAGR